MENNKHYIIIFYTLLIVILICLIQSLYNSIFFKEGYKNDSIFKKNRNVILMGDFKLDKENLNILKNDLKYEIKYKFNIQNISKKCETLDDFSNQIRIIKRSRESLNNEDTYIFISIGINDIINASSSCDDFKKGKKSSGFNIKKILGGNTPSHYDNNKKKIKDSECDESCYSCGYGKENNKNTDCIECKKGYVLEPLYSDGTGKCIKIDDYCAIDYKSKRIPNSSMYLKDILNKWKEMLDEIKAIVPKANKIIIGNYYFSKINKNSNIRRPFKECSLNFNFTNKMKGEIDIFNKDILEYVNNRKYNSTIGKYEPITYANIDLGSDILFKDGYNNVKAKVIKVHYTGKYDIKLQNNSDEIVKYRVSNKDIKELGGSCKSMRLVTRKRHFDYLPMNHYNNTKKSVNSLIHNTVLLSGDDKTKFSSEIKSLFMI